MRGGEIAWEESQELGRLSVDAVHLWCADLSRAQAAAAGFWHLLSEDERRRAERFRFEADRQRYICRHGILRMLAAHYAGLDAAGVRFVYGPHGKPELDETVNLRAVRFSLSHSRQTALFAFTIARSIGVDVEVVRPVVDADQIAGQLFLPGAVAALRSAAPGQRDQEFLRAWTRTEALLKGLGTGLVSFSDGGDSGVAYGPTPESMVMRSDALWSVHNVAPISGCIAAVAVEGPDWQLSCYTWSTVERDDGAERRTVHSVPS